MKEMVLASRNKHKLEEIGDILKEFNINIKSLDEVGLGNLEVVEDGETFEENSMKKAVEVMSRINAVVIADDSGLEVDALDNRPGVYSARFAGENATDEDNNKKLIEMLEDEENRKARFVSVISVAFPDGRKFHVRGECVGEIGYEKRGKSGFGYDPLFIVDGYDKTFAELGSDIKNKISHRANALVKLREKLAELL
ncbi:XTP/dITP diphosphatase [Anaeromicrobium sediminis]|uniref:dITP/XTP pyrophosphatase n=1 Tax=Anaeromicrobium sediminis TaxID=1478221 RepID=A0A267MHX8_9FIRM|nr:XTP/dITP diphosphatase [Anaeromicrobium sediminis]PAB58538.1 non-canonical purine NTP pyrophosphatase [Anaeromicrobium sediminis]